MSYASVEEYIEENHYDYIFDKVFSHYIEIKNHLDLHTYMVPYPKFIKLEAVFVDKIYFKDDNFDNTNEFKLVVTAEFTLKGDSKNDYEDDTNYRKFLVTCNGVFNNGIDKLKILEVEEYNSKPYQYKEGLSEFAIPYIAADDLERRAEIFLKKYYPEALETPMSLPINKILSNMGVTAYNAPLGKSIFGKAIFGKTIDKIYNDDNEVEEKALDEKTILVNPDVCFFRNLGSYNNTVIHECVHIELHSKYFELQKILNKGSKSIVCRVGNGYSNPSNKERKAYNLMEWQATMLAPRILMPLNTTNIKYFEIMDEIEQNYSNKSDVFKIELAVESLADFFNVSKQAAKIRLIDLGFDIASGIGNYVNGEKLPNFAFKSQTLNRNQTYVIDFIDSVIQIRSNEILSRLSREGKITYVNGLVVINSPEFVTINEQGKKTLTEYALNHIDKCAFIFSKNQVQTKNVYDDYLQSLYFLCRPESKTEYVSAKYDKNSSANKSLEQFADELDDIRNAKELLKKMNGEFYEDFTLVVKELGYVKSDGEPNYYQIQNLTQVSDKTIKTYLSGVSKPQKEKLLAICGGLCIHTRIAYKLFEKAGISITSSFNEDDAIYCSLIERHYDEGLEQWNKYLRDAKKTELP